MKRLLGLVTFAALAIAPFGALAQPQPIPSSMYGAGPHGFDWAIGTWSCNNAMPSPAGGPSTQTVVVTRTNGGAIFYHATGANFDNSWYNVYVPRTKTWLSPFILADGSYGTESTTQTGQRILWIGSATDAAGSTMHIRDTNVISAAKYTDLGEFQSGGTWKPQYSVTCTRT